MSEATEIKPKALGWFRIYLGLIVLLYLGILGTGIWLSLNPGMLEQLEGVETAQANLAVGVYCGVGALFSVVFAAGFFLKREPWHWMAGALLIAMSLGLCVTLIPGFILFYFWLQPEVRHWFGRD